MCPTTKRASSTVVVSAGHQITRSWILANRVPPLPLPTAIRLTAPLGVAVLRSLVSVVVGST